MRSGRPALAAAESASASIRARSSRRSGGSNPITARDAARDRSCSRWRRWSAMAGRREPISAASCSTTLKIIESGDIDPAHLNGSWAGAFGHTQFMPSTFQRLAVDGDGDGRRDIIDSVPDALGFDRQLSCAKQAGTRGCPGASRCGSPTAINGPSGREEQAPALKLGVARRRAHRRTPARRAISPPACSCPPAQTARPFS